MVKQIENHRFFFGWSKKIIDQVCRDMMFHHIDVLYRYVCACVCFFYFQIKHQYDETKHWCLQVAEKVVEDDMTLKMTFNMSDSNYAL